MVFRGVFGLVLISSHHDSATSATMALCSVVLFFLVLTVAAVHGSISGRGVIGPKTGDRELTHRA